MEGEDYSHANVACYFDPFHSREKLDICEEDSNFDQSCR